MRDIGTAKTFQTIGYPAHTTEFWFTPHGQPEHALLWIHRHPRHGMGAVVGKRIGVVEGDDVEWERLELAPDTQAILDALLADIYERNRRATRLLGDIERGDITDLEEIKALAEEARWYMLTGRGKSPAAIREERGKALGEST